MTKSKVGVLLVGVFTAGAQAYALDDSGNITIVSDYAFRGISQTDQHLAVQGSMDVESTVGLYAGAWASNVDFNDGDEASSEVDVYAGYKRNLSKSVAADLNFLYYFYPGADSDLDYEYYEITPALSYTGADYLLEGKVSYSPEFFADSGMGLYYQGNLTLDLPREFALDFHGGYQDVEDNDAFGTPDYTDWSAAFSRAIAGFDASVAYVDTDLDQDECFSGTGLCDGRVILSVGRDL